MRQAISATAALLVISCGRGVVQDEPVRGAAAAKEQQAREEPLTAQQIVRLYEEVEREGARRQRSDADSARIFAARLTEYGRRAAPGLMALTREKAEPRLPSEALCQAAFHIDRRWGTTVAADVLLDPGLHESVLEDFRLWAAEYGITYMLDEMESRLEKAGCPEERVRIAGILRKLAYWLCDAEKGEVIGRAERALRKAGAVLLKELHVDPLSAEEIARRHEEEEKKECTCELAPPPGALFVNQLAERDGLRAIPGLMALAREGCELKVPSDTLHWAAALIDGRWGTTIVADVLLDHDVPDNVREAFRAGAACGDTFTLNEVESRLEKASTPKERARIATELEELAKWMLEEDHERWVRRRASRALKKARSVLRRLKAG